jgi:hypothetical protein
MKGLSLLCADRGSLLMDLTINKLSIVNSFIRITQGLRSPRRAGLNGMSPGQADLSADVIMASMEWPD